MKHIISYTKSPLDPNLVLVTDPSTRKILRSIFKKRAILGQEDLMRRRDEHLAHIHNVSQKIESVSHGDGEVFANTTCDIPWTKPTHYAIEETGTFIMSDPKIKYSKEVVDRIIAKYKKLKPEKESYSITVPRGKNTGWPFFIPGAERDVNDIGLYVTAKYTEKAMNEGMTLKEMYEEVGKGVGVKPFYSYAERAQHHSHSNLKPYYYTDRFRFKIGGIFPKLRTVNMADKMALMKNRASIKKFVQYMLVHPEHYQDRPRLMSEISGYIRDKNWEVIPWDHSKYDLHIGKGKLEDCCRIIASVLDEPKLADDLLTELSGDKMYPYEGQGYRLTGLHILPSGVSSTSAIGTVNNECLTETMKDLIKAKIGVSYEWVSDRFKFLTWGDDTICFVHNELIDKMGNKDKLITYIADIFSKNYNAEIGVEPLMKYLGTIYEPYVGYPFYRYFQNSFWPEKIKHPSLWKLGMAVRYSLLSPEFRDPAGHISAYIQGYFLSQLAKKIPQSVDSYKIEWPKMKSEAYREKLIAEGVKASQEIATGVQDLDSILYLLHHGSGDLDFASEILGIDFEDMDREVSLDELQKDVTKMDIKDSRYDTIVRGVKLSKTRGEALSYMRSMFILTKGVVLT